ncbi:MAG: hypothetical protein JNJ94_05510 [Chlorobi bacterium]|nr:hypothetical protein [Chlorobiota bacterium]
MMWIIVIALLKNEKGNERTPVLFAHCPSSVQWNWCSQYNRRADFCCREDTPTAAANATANAATIVKKLASS